MFRKVKEVFHFLLTQLGCFKLLVEKKRRLSLLFDPLITFTVIFFVLQNTLISEGLNKKNNLLDTGISCEHYVSKKEWMYDDFIFNKKGTTFYTYKKGILHQWNLGNSINHEKSIMIGIDFSKYKHQDNIDFMFLNNDESKMIFWTEDFFEIWDIKQKKCIGRKYIKSIFGTVDSDKNIFFTLDRKNLLRKWNINNLIEEKSVNINFGCETWDSESGIHAPSCKPVKLLTIDNNIYIIAYSVVVKLDIENMQELKKNFIGPCWFGNISFDKKTFNCDGKNIDIFSLNKSESIVKVSVMPNPRWGRYFMFNKLYIRKARVYNKMVYFLENLENKNRLGYFLHNDEGDWIIKNRNYFDSNMIQEKLQISCGNNRKVLPMNKEVYRETYKKINFKDLTHGNN